MQSCTDEKGAGLWHKKKGCRIQCFYGKSNYSGMYHCLEEIALFHHHKVSLSLDCKQRKTHISHLDPVFMQVIILSES